MTEEQMYEIWHVDGFKADRTFRHQTTQEDAESRAAVLNDQVARGKVGVEHAERFYFVRPARGPIRFYVEAWMGDDWSKADFLPFVSRLQAVEKMNWYPEYETRVVDDLGIPV